MNVTNFRKKVFVGLSPLQVTKIVSQKQKELSAKAVGIATTFMQYITFKLKLPVKFN